MGVNPARACGASGFVITMISDDGVLKSLVFGTDGLANGMKEGSIHISMSTVSPSIVDFFEREHKERKTTLLSAPVSGRPERAKEGTLWIFLSGKKEGKAAATPVLKAMSSKIYDLGDEAKKASIFKLASNFMILSFIETLSEALSVLEKSGISLQTANEIWGTSFYDAPIFRSYSPPLVQKTYFEGGFMLDLARKDMRLLKEFIEDNLVPMPLLDLITEKQMEAQAMGKGKFDCTIVDLLTRKHAGL
jgi:3-hydroxyisobutyrate dehydrogenase-like beta-hydroxyacid dehydrogenase